MRQWIFKLEWGFFQLSSNSMPNFQATLIVDGIQIQSIHPTLSVNF